MTDQAPPKANTKPAAKAGTRRAKTTAAAIVDNTPTSRGGKGAAAAGAQERGPSQATVLVGIADKAYTLGCTPDGEPFAIPRRGPRIVRMLRGGRQSLRAELAQAYYAASDTAASQSALADACAVIEGQAQRMEPTPLHLRVAAHDGRLVLDLGDATGRCVVVTTTGWEVVANPPVLFARTALTGALPAPTRGGKLDQDLWPALNVAEKYRPLIVAVLVAALIEDIPHPVVLLSGEQGTGKSTATARLSSVLDPSPAQLRKAPRDADTAVTAAAGSWMVAVDNLSTMQDWFSDELCRWSTGNGDVRRRLYSNGDLHVIAFRRSPIINGIDLGDLRGDLADRLVHIVLDRIPDTERRPAAELDKAWQAAHPRVLGAILDTAVKVLARLPDITLDELPRMADFAQILAAVDQVLGTEGLKTYLGLRDELAHDAITSDPVLVALTDMVTEEFTGTSAELLALLTPSGADPNRRPPKGWPARARDLTTILTRQAPTLRRLGWAVDKGARGDSRAKVLRWTLTPPREQRRSAEDAANAADAAHGASSQVSGGAQSAATGAATPRQHQQVAAPGSTTAATPTSCRTDAAPHAAPGAPHLSSANEDHAATAATAATSADLLCSTTPTKCSLCGLHTRDPLDAHGRCPACT